PLRALEFVVDRAELDVVLSYCHFALNDTSLLTLVPLLRERGIGVINAAPLSMGLLSDSGPPRWHPAPVIVRDASARAAALCRERGTDLSRLAIQFSASNSPADTTLVGMGTPEQVVANVESASSAPDSELLSDVLKIM